MSKLFLGLDLSTQSLSAVVIDYDTRQVVYEKSLNFDSALPQYKTSNGVLPNRDPLIKHSPPLMWADALDLLFHEMKNDQVDLSAILAISGSGQQHGSVYLNHIGEHALQGLDPHQTLAENLRDGFSRDTSPIWMDASTTTECKEIRASLGGIKATSMATGSDTFERFTGPQIRKFYKTEPDAYKDTGHIALVSSFMAAILSGKIAPIDYGDGAGMNLMDIHKKTWHPEALKATAPDLENKLPKLSDCATPIGEISSYFVKKFGFNANTIIFPSSGDNPCSVVGLGLIKQGQVAISLGTSDTYFGVMNTCQVDPNGEGHVFGSPTGDYMTLICFKNGSLAREKIREHYHIENWQAFEKIVASTKPSADNGIILPWFEAEIVPRVNKPGIHRFNLDENNIAANCRAIFESQMLAMRHHSQWMNVKPQCIFATGGASNNLSLLQIMSDVMNCEVKRLEISNSAALGAALIAAHGYHLIDKKINWEDIIKGFSDPIVGSQLKPNAAAVKVYDKLIEKYEMCEREALMLI